MPDAVQIEFVRLTAVPLEAVVELLNEPRNARHMPLAGAMSSDEVARWVRDKDGQWDAYGYGPWAVLVGGEFAGWGGFQREENGADFALVLLPRFWGQGLAITRVALAHGFTELGLTSVLIALPFTRSPTRVVARLGFVPDGEVGYGGSTFRQYRLTREAYAQLAPSWTDGTDGADG